MYFPDSHVFPVMISTKETVSVLLMIIIAFCVFLTISIGGGITCPDGEQIKEYIEDLNKTSEDSKGNNIQMKNQSIEWGNGKGKYSGMERESRFPQAIVIGAKKGGTGALRDMLNHHADIAYVKREIHFFDFYYEDGYETYKSWMPESIQSQITMEGSPSYFICIKCPQRMHEFNKNLKLIMTMRDPIKRFVSEYFHKRRKGLFNFRKISIEELVQNKKHNDTLMLLLNHSRYGHHLSRYLKFFPLNQIHIVDGDRLAYENPAGELSKIEDFLGLPHRLTKDKFRFEEELGFYCYYKDHLYYCLGDNKGNVHPPLSDKSNMILKRILAEDIKMLHGLVNKEFVWSESYISPLQSKPT